MVFACRVNTILLMVTTAIMLARGLGWAMAMAIGVWPWDIIRGIVRLAMNRSMVVLV